MHNIRRTFSALAALVLSSNLLFGQLVVESGLSFRFNVPPGAEAQSIIRLFNAGSTPQKYHLVKMDVQSDCEHGYTYLPEDSLAESNASWVSAERYFGELQPGERTSIKVQAVVPQEFNEASARSCIMVESTASDSVPNEGSLNIKLRYAIGVLYRNPMLPGDVVLKAQRLDLDSNSGIWSLRYLNAGNVDRIVSSRVRVLDSNGRVVYSYDKSPAKGIVPNQCRTFEFASRRPTSVAPGTYRLVVLSETDEGEKFGVTKELIW